MKKIITLISLVISGNFALAQTTYTINQNEENLDYSSESNILTITNSTDVTISGSFSSGDAVVFIPNTSNFIRIKPTPSDPGGIGGNNTVAGGKPKDKGGSGGGSNSITIYPVPVQTYLSFNSSYPINSYYIMNLSNIQERTGTFAATLQYQIYVGDLPNAWYILKLQQENGQVVSLKFQKN